MPLIPINKIQSDINVYVYNKHNTGQKIQTVLETLS